MTLYYCEKCSVYQDNPAVLMGGTNIPASAIGMNVCRFCNSYVLEVTPELKKRVDGLKQTKEESVKE